MIFVSNLFVFILLFSLFSSNKEYVAGKGETGKSIGFQPKGDMIIAAPVRSLSKIATSPEQKALDLLYSSLDENEDGIPDDLQSGVKIAEKQVPVYQPSATIKIAEKQAPVYQQSSASASQKLFKRNTISQPRPFSGQHPAELLILQLCPKSRTTFLHQP